MAVTTPFAQFLIAFMILVVALVVGQTAKRALLRFFSQLRLDRRVAAQFGFSLSLTKTLSYGVSYLIYFGGLLWALSEMGVSARFLQWAFVVFLVVLFVLIMLAFKDFLPNLLAGLYILMTKRLKVGDTLEVSGVKGKVVAFSLVETRVQIKGGDVIFLPNSLLTKQKVQVKHG